MTTDLAIFRDTKPNTVIRYTPGLALEGSGKLVHKFASLFFSDYDETRDRGTFFMPYFRSGRLTTDASIVTRFAISASQVIRQLGDQSQLPKSEQIIRARLTNFQRLAADSVYLEVTLYTADGEINIVLPVENVS